MCIDILFPLIYTNPMNGTKVLFIIGLLILAGGIGTLVYGISGLAGTEYYQRAFMEKDYESFIGRCAKITALTGSNLYGLDITNMDKSVNTSQWHDKEVDVPTKEEIETEIKRRTLEAL